MKKIDLSDVVSLAALTLALISFIFTYGATRAHDLASLRPVLTFVYGEDG